jgi:multiple sugar transport system substrate-binding protein
MKRNPAHLRRTICLILAFMLLLSFTAGCGTTTPAATTAAATTAAATTAAATTKAAETTAAATETTAAATEATPAPASNEKVTISYLNWNGGEEMRLQQEAIAEYMSKNPNITIQGQWVTENYDSKINTLIAADQTPDIYYINEYLAVDWGEKGVALDMAPLFSEMGVNMEQTYVKSAIFVYNKKVYGLSTGPVCLLLYYNKAMFDDNKIAYPSTDPMNPWTWAQLVDAAKQLTFDTAGKKPGEAGFKPKQIKSYGMIAPSFWLWMQAFLYSDNTGYATADGMASGLDSVAGREVLQAVYDLIYKDQVSPDAAVAKTLPGTTQAFKNKQLAMNVSGTWEYANFMKESIDFGIAPLPMFKKPMNISWAATNQISAKTKNPKEVAKFLMFLTDPDVNPRQLSINFPNKLSWYQDTSKLDSWIKNGNFKDDFKKVIPLIMSDVAIVPENVNLKNFNKLVGEIAQAEIDKYLGGNQDLETTIANITKASVGQWQGKW